MVEADAKRLEEGFGNKPAVNEEDHKKDDLISTEKVVNKSDGGSGDAIDHVEEKEAVSVPLVVEQIKGEEEQPPQVKQKSNRVATLDAFRGLTIVVCKLV